MWRPGIWLGGLILIGGTLACNLQPGVPVTPTLIATQPRASLTISPTTGLIASPITSRTISPTAIPPSPTETPSDTTSPTITDSATVTPSITASITMTPSHTPTFTITPSRTPSPTRTRRPDTRTATATITNTLTVTPTATISRTVTPSLTLTPLPTDTITPSLTLTNSLTPSLTPTLTLTLSPTLTPLPAIPPSAVPTLTLLPTQTPIPPSAIPTLIPASTLFPTITLTPSNTATLLSLVPVTQAPPTLAPSQTQTFSLIPATPNYPTARPTLTLAISLTPSLTPIPIVQRFITPLPTRSLTPINGGNNGNGSGGNNGSGNNGSTGGAGAGTPIVGPYATVTALALTPIPTNAFYSIYGNGTPSIYRLNGSLFATVQPGQIQYAVNPQTGQVAAINNDGVLSINNSAFTLSPYSVFGPPPHLHILKVWWSPDGRFLLFMTMTDNAESGKLDFAQTINDGLWVYDAAAHSTRQIFRNQYICCANLPIQIVADAAWTADSQNVLIWLTSDPNRLTPFLVNSTQTINLNPAPGH